MSDKDASLKNALFLNLSLRWLDIFHQEPEKADGDREARMSLQSSLPRSLGDSMDKYTPRQ